MYRSKCALANFLDHFGDKWSLLIIRDMFIEKKTFNDFIKAVVLPQDSVGNFNSDM